MPQLTANQGLSLLEIIVTIAILAIIALGTYGLFNYSLQITGENQIRIQAIAVANEVLEEIINFPYLDIGTINGVPSGETPQTQEITRNKINFTVSTDIRYIDDPFDGTLGGVPEDLLSTDYKKIRIEIDWPRRFYTRDVILVTNIAPKGIETTAGGGTLKITVFDANPAGVQPVVQAEVSIVNNEVNPTVNINTQTDGNGEVLLPGAPAGNNYEIVVTKNGYSTAQTYSSPNPPYAIVKHVSVLEGELTETSFQIDRLSTLDIETISQDLPDGWQINTDDSGEDQTNSKVDVDVAGNMYFVWEDLRSGGDERIYSQKYDPSKNQDWLSDLWISSPVKQENHALAVDAAGNFYITWNDSSTGNQDIYLKKYDTAGNDLWSGSHKIEVDAGSADQTLPHLILDKAQENIYLVFQDNRSDNGDIYAQKYDTSGEKIWSSDLRINSDTGSASQTNPRIALDSTDNVYVVWQDDRNGHDDIYAQKFNHEGVKLWTVDLKINTDTGSASQTNPRIVLNSLDDLYIAWQDDRNTNYDIYVERYNSAGIREITGAWVNGDLKVNIHSPAADQINPAMTVNLNNDNFYIVWADYRNKNYDIYVQGYEITGYPLWNMDQRINLDSAGATQTNPDISINESGTLIIAWQDDRQADYDIRAATYNGPGTITQLTAIGLTITLDKKIYNEPDTYKYQETLNTDVYGQLTLPNLEFGNYTVTLEPPSGYTLAVSEPSQPFYLEPNTTQEVTLILE